MGSFDSDKIIGTCFSMLIQSRKVVHVEEMILFILGQSIAKKKSFLIEKKGDWGIKDLMRPRGICQYYFI